MDSKIDLELSQQDQEDEMNAIDGDLNDKQSRAWDPRAVLDVLMPVKRGSKSNWQSELQKRISRKWNLDMKTMRDDESSDISDVSITPEKNKNTQPDDLKKNLEMKTSEVKNSSKYMTEISDPKLGFGKNTDNERIPVSKEHSNEFQFNKIIKIYNWVPYLNNNCTVSIHGQVDGVLFQSQEIVARHTEQNIQDKDGRTYVLIGPLDSSRGTDLPQFVQLKFNNGFPEDWESDIKIWTDTIVSISKMVHATTSTAVASVNNIAVASNATWPIYVPAPRVVQPNSNKVAEAEKQSTNKYPNPPKPIILSNVRVPIIENYPPKNNDLPTINPSATTGAKTLKIMEMIHCLRNNLFSYYKDLLFHINDLETQILTDPEPPLITNVNHSIFKTNTACIHSREQQCSEHPGTSRKERFQKENVILESNVKTSCNDMPQLYVNTEVIPNATNSQGINNAVPDTKHILHKQHDAHTGKRKLKTTDSFENQNGMNLNNAKVQRSAKSKVKSQSFPMRVMETKSVSNLKLENHNREMFEPVTNLSINNTQDVINSKSDTYFTLQKINPAEMTQSKHNKEITARRRSPREKIPVSAQPYWKNDLNGQAPKTADIFEESYQSPRRIVEHGTNGVHMDVMQIYETNQNDIESNITKYSDIG